MKPVGCPETSVTIKQRRVTSQKSKALIYTAVENQTSLKYKAYAPLQLITLQVPHCAGQHIPYASLELITLQVPHCAGQHIPCASLELITLQVPHCAGQHIPYASLRLITLQVSHCAGQHIPSCTLICDKNIENHSPDKTILILTICTIYH